MDKTTFFNTLALACEQNSISALATPAVREHLFALYELLVSENSKYNLTAITSPEDVIYKHFVDCMLLAQHIPADSTLIDVGCGAGFPSLPLCIVRPDLKITALDSTNKKIHFIQLVAERLKLQNITAICGRAEEIARDVAFRDSFDISTARAVANFPVLCELCLPFVRPGGVFLAMKGRYSEQEFNISPSSVGQLSANAPIVSTYLLNIGDANEQRTLIKVNKIGKTRDNFPRKYAQITKKPLI
ncbi:MAG: 16S rRNA (guanine(527)-N(7))-methyltransferase RsmG [Clostridia bacterium]|nr:16S rRNA (guanine(527)-N(7))-methyltransferase RsmG [Clostridia bacterium]